MTINIILPSLNSDINNVTEFEYTLGYFELKIGKNKVLFFSKKYCMIFYTIENLYTIFNQLNINNNDTFEWIGEDNGNSFDVTFKNNNIHFFSNDFCIILNYEKFYKSLTKSIIIFQKKLIKLNVEIIKEKYFTNFMNLTQNL